MIKRMIKILLLFVAIIVLAGMWMSEHSPKKSPPVQRTKPRLDAYESTPTLTEPRINPRYQIGIPFESPDCNPMDPTGKIHQLPPVRYDREYPSSLPRSNSMLVAMDPDATFQRLM